MESKRKYGLLRQAYGLSRNDDSVVDSHDSATQNLAMRLPSYRLCEAFLKSVKQFTPLLHSLRGSPQGLTKQSIIYINSNTAKRDFIDFAVSNSSNIFFIDCHDSATQNLAMTKEKRFLRFSFYGLPRLDFIKSRNDERRAILRKNARNLAMTEIGRYFCDSVESPSFDSTNSNLPSKAN